MNPKELRDGVAWLDACLEDMVRDGEGNVRSLDADEQTRFDEGLALREQYARDIARHEQIASLSRVPGAVERPSAPNVNVTRTAQDVHEDRSSSPREITDALLRELEPNVEADNLAHVEKVLRTHTGRGATYSDREWARSLLIRSTDVYESAWWKVVNGRDMALTDEERTALGVTTNANGKFLLPTHLDPTIILTNSGSSNIIRSLARVVTLTDGQPAWNGVTSAGVTASWDGEVVEVSDDSPTFSQPSIGTTRAQAFVEASISAEQDISGLANDVMMLFADAKDRLEGAAHATGSGTGQPKGIFTALNADTNVQVTSTTAATIGLVDLHALYKAVPIRWRKKSTWLMNPTYSLAVKALGTALSASYTTDLTQDTTGVLLGRPVTESDDAPTTQTTTALDNEIVLGDFSNYVIVDRPGSMLVEYIPHLFNTANNLPDGRRGWYCSWRNGADVVSTSPFRLLVDKTSA